jgi:integrase
MRKCRTALPLPRYVIRLWSKRSGAWVYYFNLPHWARAAGCPVGNETLGADHGEAVRRAETVLLPTFDSWRGGGATSAEDAPSKAGTLDWLFSQYRADRRFTKLPTGSRRDKEGHLRLVGNHVMNDGRKLGIVRLASITTSVVDTLYDKLLIVKETDAQGNVIERERRTTVNMAMRTCRRAWFLVARSNPDKVPFVNPFSKMGLEASQRETPTATFAELQTFRAKARELGYPSLATAALIAWEFVQRRIDIFATFEVAHYRPKEHPNACRVIHGKTQEENWVPLLDEKGVPIYPELMAELDAIKRERIGGLMLVRDWGDRRPWPTWPTEDDPDLSYMAGKVREVIRAAGLRDELSFASFRHGGFTECGDAELSDRLIMAQGRHRSPKVLSRYVKRTMKQVAKGAKMRRAVREAE